MKDVRGVNIEIGQRVLYTSHDRGDFWNAVVVGFTNNSVKLVAETGYRRDTFKKLPKFIVVL